MVGADVGIEYHFYDQSYSVYAEGQVGVGIAGASIGPVFHSTLGRGWQTTLWANAFVGGFYRTRHLQEQQRFIGAYVKVPPNILLE